MLQGCPELPRAAYLPVGSVGALGPLVPFLRWDPLGAGTSTCHTSKGDASRKREQQPGVGQSSLCATPCPPALQWDLPGLKEQPPSCSVPLPTEQAECCWQPSKPTCPHVCPQPWAPPAAQHRLRCCSAPLSLLPRCQQACRR